MMAASCSEDEFSDLWDNFDDVDWESVPGMKSGVGTPEPPSTIVSTSSHLSTTTHVITPPPRPSSANSSSFYDFDDLDDDILTQVDQIERNYAASQATGPLTLSTVSLSSNSTNLPATGTSPKASPSLVKRAASNELDRTPPKKTKPSDLPPTSPKGKSKERSKSEINSSVREMLDQYEDELTCPICCDIFAVAHLTNPCGHTCCGSCLWNWIAKNQRKPTCSMCRAPLNIAAPMIPNFSVDAAVQRHVEQLKSQKIDGWETGGSKIVALNERKGLWKAECVQRAAAEAKGRSRSRSVAAANVVREPINGYVVDVWEVPDDEDGYYES